VAQRPKSGPGRLIVENSRSQIRHTHTHTAVGLLWTSDQPVQQTANYTTQQTQEKNIHVLDGIRTRDSSIQQATGLRLSPRRHRNRMQMYTLASYCGPMS